MARAQAVDERGRWSLVLLVGVLLVPAVLGSSGTIFNDGDVSWHIASGQWILDHRAIPHSDPFSFTWAGKPWTPIEWLSEVVYASGYRLAGYAGVAAIVTAALIALHALVCVGARRAVGAIAALGTIVAMDAVLIPMMLARPHLLTWPLLAGWTLLMLRARERDRAPPLVAALLMTLWANLHGSFLMGLAIAGVFGLEALIASGAHGRALRQWLVFGLACVVALFINANGFEGVAHPIRILGLSNIRLIDEWKPSSLAVTPFFFAVFAITLVLIAWKRPRLHWIRWLLLAGLLTLALLQQRHQPVLAIVAAMILPQGFARGRVLASQPGRERWMVAAGAVLLVLVRGAMPLSPPANEANPWALIAAVPRDLRAQPVLNGYSMGGPLILSGIRPYIDGRGDLYGDAFTIDYAHISSGDAAAFARAVQQWDIRWAILPNRSKALIGVIDRSPGWRRIARDEVGVVYVRSPGVSAS